MIKIRPDLEMRESDQTWLGKIPGDWLLSRAGGLFKERREKVSDKEFPPLSVTKHGVVPQLENAAKSDDNDNRKKVVSGDYVINSRSDRKGSSGLSKLTGSVSLINTVITPVGIDPFFCNHLLRSVPFQEEYYRWGKGIVADLWSTNFSDLKNIKIPVPNPVEQRQIAAYLNRETAKIDKLISKQQQLIKLLQEKLQAVISRAVTKGLDPNVRMRDSGIEWLGEAPEHWSVIKLGFVYQMRSGDAITIENIEVEGTFPVYGGNGLRGYSEKYTHYGNFLLMGRQGALCGNIHKVSGKFWASEHAVVLKPLMSCVASYMANLLRHMKLGQYSVSAAQPGLSVDVISKLRIPFPPIEEQLTIAGYLDEQESSIRTLVEKSITSISLLKEHRQALITAAVTGKIDVRGLVTDEEVAALDAEPVLETTEEDFESEVAEADYIIEEE